MIIMMMIMHGDHYGHDHADNVIMRRMAMMIVQGLPRPWPQASAARHADFSTQIQSNYEHFMLDFRATKRRSGKKTFLNT